jgi:hypothetical protein
VAKITQNDLSFSMFKANRIFFFEANRFILPANRIFHVQSKSLFHVSKQIDLSSKSIFQANRSGPIFELGQISETTSSPD